MKISVKNIGAIALLILCTTTSLWADETLLDDTFSGSQRLKKESLPSSTPWYVSSGPMKSIPVVSNGQLVWQTDHWTGFIIGYFTPVNSPRKLEVGESMTLTIQFSVEGTKDVNYGLRVALLDSGGSRVAADSAGLDGGGILYSLYAGYGVMLDLGENSNNPMQICKRNSSGSALQLVTNSALNPIKNHRANAPRPKPGTPQTLTLTVKRTTDTDVSVSVSLNGVTSSVTDMTDPVTQFDTVCVFHSDGQAESMELSRISVACHTGTDSAATQ